VEAAIKPILLFAILSFALSAAEQSVPFLGHVCYLEKSDSGRLNETSYYACASPAQFDRIFGPDTHLGRKTCRGLLPDGIFVSKLVVAIIRRGKCVRVYDAKKITARDNTLYVW
jgi:hypothetical protein